MKSSESIKELASALAKAQASMENASKDKDNPFFRSKYANLESVVGVIRPAIEPHGLSFIQVCHDWDVGAKVETIILHESGEWLSCGVMSAPAMKADAQGFGSALTYARRYSLSAAFGVATEDDDGRSASKRKGRDTPEGDKPTDADAEWAEGLAMQVRSLMTKQDIKGAAEVLNTLGVGGSYDAEAKEAAWSRLESPIRSALKAYDAISQARTLDSLKLAWDAAPKHSHVMLLPVKDKRKAELTAPNGEYDPQQAAA